MDRMSLTKADCMLMNDSEFKNGSQFNTLKTKNMQCKITSVFLMI